MPIAINKQELNHFQFPGGECQVNVSSLALADRYTVEAFLRSSYDIMCLILTIDALKRRQDNLKLDLIIPYLPYARQDRVCAPGDAFGLDVMAKLINDLNCDSVTVFDPHSIVSEKAIHNIKIIAQDQLILESPLAEKIKNENLVLVAPDKGALCKTQKLASRLSVDAIYCQKQRNPMTGKILGLTVPDTIPDRDLIIIDDICDGGRTFLEVAKGLREKTQRKIYLYVTHGIFSKGIDLFRKDFSQIFYANCFLNNELIDPNFLIQIQGVQNEN